MKIDAYFFLQWIAMGVTVGASWLVAASSENRRNAGFWVFLVSNALWIVWGVARHRLCAGNPADRTGGHEYSWRHEDLVVFLD